MNGLELRKWRELLGYTQQDAADEFGVTRATIQNWEYGITPVPVAVHLASRHLTLRWKQRAEFGPVTLVYTSATLPPPNGVDRLPSLACKRYPDNNAAFRNILELRNDTSLFNLFIIDDDNSVIWSGPQLIQESEKLCENEL